MDVDDLETETLDPLEKTVHGGLIGVFDPETGRVTRHRDIDICEGLPDGWPRDSPDGYLQNARTWVF